MCLGVTRLHPRLDLRVGKQGSGGSASGQILTNHHVAEPWWQNDDLKKTLDQGVLSSDCCDDCIFPWRTTGHCHQH